MPRQRKNLAVEELLSVEDRASRQDRRIQLAVSQMMIVWAKEVSLSWESKFQKNNVSRINPRTFIKLALCLGNKMNFWLEAEQTFKDLDNLKSTVLTNNVNKWSHEERDVDQDEDEALQGGEYGHGGEDASHGGRHLHYVSQGHGAPACHVTSWPWGRGQPSHLVTPSPPGPPTGEQQVSRPAIMDTR